MSQEYVLYTSHRTMTWTDSGGHNENCDCYVDIVADSLSAQYRLCSLFLRIRLYPHLVTPEPPRSSAVDVCWLVMSNSDGISVDISRNFTVTWSATEDWGYVSNRIQITAGTSWPPNSDPNFTIYNFLVKFSGHLFSDNVTDHEIETQNRGIVAQVFSDEPAEAYFPTYYDVYGSAVCIFDGSTYKFYYPFVCVPPTVSGQSYWRLMSANVYDGVGWIKSKKNEE